jgi:predicted alpha/beta hydrolase family esterase
MPLSTLPVEAYRTLKTIEGELFPYYIIPYDKEGRCEAPKTQEHLLNNAASYSDIFLFSHGWNNDWAAATERYESFIKGFQKLRRDNKFAAPEGYKPLLIGVFWPSQAMTWFDSEIGPDIAAINTDLQAQAASELLDTLRDIVTAIPEKQRRRFYELAQTGRLSLLEATELSEMLASVAASDDEGARADGLNGKDLLFAARSLEEPEPDYNIVGKAINTTESASSPKAAFDIGDIISTLDPRNIIKPFTVWQMKDRAGKVGANGLVPLLEGLLTGSKARVHLIGHSFGCKVVMTAICKPLSLKRPVESVLLLQPAVSQYAFAAKVPERDVPGGFANALNRDRVRWPIMVTYSANDVALTKLFHIAVRRHDDLGELQFAGAGSPSHFGALGGFGPQETDSDIEDILQPIQFYDLKNRKRIIGVNGTKAISGHGDISNEFTWWLEYNLATAHTHYPS